MTSNEIKKELEEIKDRLDVLAKATSAVSETGRTKSELADHNRIVAAYFATANAFWDIGQY